MVDETILREAERTVAELSAWHETDKFAAGLVHVRAVMEFMRELVTPDVVSLDPQAEIDSPPVTVDEIPFGDASDEVVADVPRGRKARG